MKYFYACVVLVAVASLADFAAMADRWEGVWAFEKDWCKYSDQIGERDPAPIKITRNEFVGLENWCAVTQLNAVAGEMVLDLACEGEGETYSDRIYLRIEGANLKIRRIGEEVLQYHRCE
jgi:hypothetical protein